MLIDFHRGDGTVFYVDNPVCHRGDGLVVGNDDHSHAGVTGGILQQLIARKIDVTKVKKSIFDVDYSDFFHINENFEYYYEN